MSNSNDRLNAVNRAVIAGTVIATTRSCLEQWRSCQQGEKDVHQAAKALLHDAAKATLIGASAMAIAQATAGRPVLTLLTALTTGVATLYLLDDVHNKER
ncbi:MAG: hypothetical protein ACRC5A_05055 [Enterobacteriaceae bacterium]